MVIYFNEDLRARSSLDWLGRTYWRYESAKGRGEKRKWRHHPKMRQQEFERTLDGPPPEPNGKDFRAMPQKVGLCLR